MFSRKSVITEVANKGGGAHVASLIPESYDMLSRPGGILKVTLGSGADNVEVPIAGVHFVMLRQMAYEILNSPALLALADPENDRKTSPGSRGSATSHEGENGSPRSEAIDPDPMRDKIARYFAAYYQAARSQLAGRSFSIETVPSHLMPWKNLVRTWETKDSHFVIEHISSPATLSYLGNESMRSDLYEDYLHLYPSETRR